MRILVTGATGFIGNHLVAELIKKNNVRILARNKNRAEKLEKVEISYGSLEDYDSLLNATKDVDIVYHLAAMLGSPEIPYEKIYSVNVKGTENLLRACEENNVKRFVLISSVAAMGPVSSMANEETKCVPKTDYDKTKYLSEIAVKKSGLGWTIVRPTMVYGPGETENKAKMFRFIQKGFFFIIGSGSNLMSLVYVDNLVKGIVKAGESKKALKQTYILSDSRAYTMNEFVKTIAKSEGVRMPIHLPVFFAYIGAFFFRIFGIFGIPRLLSKDRIKNMITGRSFDISKAVKELGYNPKIGLNEGVKRTVEWYKEKGILK